MTTTTKTTLMMMMMTMMIQSVSTVSTRSPIRLDIDERGDDDLVISPGLVFKKIDTAVFIENGEGYFVIELRIGAIFNLISDVRNKLEETISLLQTRERRHSETYYSNYSDFIIQLTSMKESSEEMERSLRDGFLNYYVTLLPDSEGFDSSSSIISRVTSSSSSYSPFDSYTHRNIIETIDHALELCRNSLAVSNSSKVKIILYDVVFTFNYAIIGTQAAISSFVVELTTIIRNKRLSPTLINETEMFDFLGRALSNYSTDNLIVPYSREDVKHYYTLCSILDITRLKSDNTRVFIKLNIPLRAVTNTYDVYQIIPVYMSRRGRDGDDDGSGGGFSIRTSHRFLAVSSDLRLYAYVDNYPENCQRLLSAPLDISTCRVDSEFISFDPGNHYGNISDSVIRNCEIAAFRDGVHLSRLRKRNSNVTHRLQPLRLHLHPSCQISLDPNFLPQFVVFSGNRYFYSVDCNSENSTNNKNNSGSGLVIKEVCFDETHTEKQAGTIVIPPGLGIFSINRHCYGVGQWSTTHYEFRNRYPVSKRNSDDIKNNYTLNFWSLDLVIIKDPEIISTVLSLPDITIVNVVAVFLAICSIPILITLTTAIIAAIYPKKFIPDAQLIHIEEIDDSINDNCKRHETSGE